MAAGSLATLYVMLVIATISFAAIQTDLASSVRDTQSAIGATETDYYAQVAKLSAVAPSSIGLVSPSRVSYAVKVAGPTLTLR